MLRNECYHKLLTDSIVQKHAKIGKKVKALIVIIIALTISLVTKSYQHEGNLCKIKLYLCIILTKIVNRLKDSSSGTLFNESLLRLFVHLFCLIMPYLEHLDGA